MLPGPKRLLNSLPSDLIKLLPCSKSCPISCLLATNSCFIRLNHRYRFSSAALALWVTGEQLPIALNSRSVSSTKAARPKHRHALCLPAPGNLLMGDAVQQNPASKPIPNPPAQSCNACALRYSWGFFPPEGVCLRSHSRG